VKKENNDTSNTFLGYSGFSVFSFILFCYALLNYDQIKNRKKLLVIWLDWILIDIPTNDIIINIIKNFNHFNMNFLILY